MLVNNSPKIRFAAEHGKVIKLDEYFNLRRHLKCKVCRNYKKVEDFKESFRTNEPRWRSYKQRKPDAYTCDQCYTININDRNKIESKNIKLENSGEHIQALKIADKLNEFIDAIWLVDSLANNGYKMCRAIEQYDVSDLIKASFDEIPFCFAQLIN